MYLAIDPGIDTGWALFSSTSDLVSCGMSDPRTTVPVTLGAVIIEKPVIYASRFMKGDPNLILTLAIGVGRYLEYFESRGAKVSLVTPGAWKGQLPKHITHSRAYAALSDNGRSVVDTAGKYVCASKRHNMLDAVALGVEAFRKRLW